MTQSTKRRSNKIILEEKKNYKIFEEENNSREEEKNYRTFKKDVASANMQKNYISKDSKENKNQQLISVVIENVDEKKKEKSTKKG